MKDNINFRNAKQGDLNQIWEIFQKAIEKRRLEGSEQWQDGYPNFAVIQDDIDRQNGFIAYLDDATGSIVGYIAIINEIEPAYEAIVGKWSAKEKYTVIHRLAVDNTLNIKGVGTFLMKHAEEICLENQTFSLRADTNFDNTAMLKVFEKLGYQYTGKVYFRGGERLAFEKTLR